MQDVSTIRPATEPDPFDSTPIPLTTTTVHHAFPVAELPTPIAAMVAAVAEATQTDPAMAGTTALTVLAAAAGGRAEIEVRAGWREPLCLYTATVAGPGERKSAVQAEMSRPLLTVEEEMAETGMAVRREAETLHAIAAKDADRLRGAASSAEGHRKDELKAEAISAASFADAIAVPAVPRIMADDITPEAAGSLIADQGGRLAIISAEGGIFDSIAGRYSNAIPSMDLWLKGHSGDPLRVDRKGRESEYVKRPALTLGLMLQPSVLSTLGTNKTFRGRGLLARFLYAAPASKVGHRKAGADPVPATTATAYHQLVVDLVRGLNGWGGDPAILQLSPQAAADAIQIEAATEPSLAGDGDLAALADWGAKYVGAVMRIAGLLHLGSHGHEEAVRTPISRTTVLSAVKIGTYYKIQAVAAFAAMHTDQVTADAVYLLDRLRRHPEATISARDMHYLTRSRFRTRADLEAPLIRLLERGWIAALPEPDPDGRGRRPSPVYAIHPEAQEV